MTDAAISETLKGDHPMCFGPTEQESFFVRGREKGWSEERIQRAWDAQQQRRALKDADELLKAPDPLKVGERVNVSEQAHMNYTETTGAEILALDGAEAWVKLRNGDRRTLHRRHLKRMPAAENAPVAAD